MRPKYLKIEGLQSFKELQVVDFEQLGENGLFGIFGPTGSGKSTILDAITLALYGNVQRALRGTQGIINIDSNEVRVCFTFELLRNSVRKTYRVERVYRRRKGAENSAESRIARLVEITGGKNKVLADKTGDVTDKVEELLGLRLDDFTRSVVLPQNKFQEFLFLEKAKKREMMERIFCLEEYGRKLTDRVSKRIYSVKNRISSVEGAMSTLGDVSEKALVEAESRMKEAYECKEKAGVELKQVEAEFQKAREVWELVRELEAVENKEKEHLYGLEEISKKQDLYENSLKSEDMINLISKYREYEKSLADTVSQLESIQQSILGLEGKLNKAKNDYEEIRRRREEERPELIQKKERLNNALELCDELVEIGRQIELLNEEEIKLRQQIELQENKINGKKSELKRREEEIEEYKSRIEGLKVDIDYRNSIQNGIRLEDNLKKAEAERNAFQTKFDELSDRISGMEKKLKEHSEGRQTVQESLNTLKDEMKRHEGLKPCERSEIIEDMNSCHNIKSVYESLKGAAAALEEINKKLVNQKGEIEKHKEEYEKAEELKRETEAKLAESRSELDTIEKKYRGSAAYMLAKTLREGEACPVCGSLSHPKPALEQGGGQVEDLEEQMNDARERMLLAEKNYREAEGECIKLAEKLKSMETQYIQTERDLLLKESEYRKLVQKLPDDMKEDDINTISEKVKLLEEACHQKQKALELWEEEIRSLNDKVLAQDSLLSSRTADEKAAKAELDAYRDNLAQIEDSLRQAVYEYNNNLELYKQFINEHGIDSIREELKRIEDNERKALEYQKQIEELQKHIKALRREIEDLAEERQKLWNSLAGIERDIKHITVQKTEKEKKVKALSGGGDIKAEIEAVDKRINYLNQYEQETLENLKGLEAEYNKLSMSRNTLENQERIYRSSLETEAYKLEKELKEKGFSSVKEAENYILSKEEREQLKQELEDFEKTKRDLETQKKIILGKLKGRTISENEWQEANEIYNAKIREKDESISSYAKAKNNYNNIKEKFELWVKMNKELQEFNRKHEMLQQIQKLLKGNSFVEFISEERLRYVAREASETLGVLTKFRYALELDSENGFVIRDNANGGVHRPVTSLSGGEVFLTSLSLALALSKQIQLKGQSPLEFFFLDEGFGTLDNSLLDTVIDSLGQLSSKNRVIGLISHVPQLKERIGKRLIVEHSPYPGRGSSVRIENA